MHLHDGHGVVREPPAPVLQLPDVVDGVQEFGLELQDLPLLLTGLVSFTLILEELPATLDHIGGLSLEPPAQLYFADKVMDILLCLGQLQLPGENSYYEGGTPGAHNARQDGYAPTAVGVGHDVAVTDREEGDGDEPHGVEEVAVDAGVVGVVVHLAQPQRPACDDKQGHHEDTQEVVGVQRHKRLEDESKVEVDPVECTQTLAGSVLVKPRVEHEEAAHQVEPEEHWERQEHVQGDLHWRVRQVAVRLGRVPEDVELARDRVH